MEAEKTVDEWCHDGKDFIILFIENLENKVQCQGRWHSHVQLDQTIKKTCTNGSDNQ